ncbi:hypothetical protein OG824_02430 [Streptomyces prunicolor]|nr:hypothetical protein [Streptomyces prunicolor]MCX5234092.1 hypothetical protein [Streptomyces prunicolor]
MKTELDTLATALHAKTDDLLKASRIWHHAGRLRHTRVMRRTLALTVAIRHNDHTRQPVLRSPAAYDH